MNIFLLLEYWRNEDGQDILESIKAFKTREAAEIATPKTFTYSYYYAIKEVQVQE